MLIGDELIYDFPRALLRVWKQMQPCHDLGVRPVQVEGRPIVYCELAQYETACFNRPNGCHVSLSEWPFARSDTALTIRRLCPAADVLSLLPCLRRAVMVLGG